MTFREWVEGRNSNQWANLGTAYAAGGSVRSGGPKFTQVSENVYEFSGHSYDFEPFLLEGREEVDRFTAYTYLRYAGQERKAGREPGDYEDLHVVNAGDEDEDE